MRHRIKWLLTFLHWLPTPVFLRWAYWLETGRWIDWCNPVTFSDKLQCLKLCGGTERYAHLVDKVAAREWAARVIGREYLPTLIGVYDRPEDISWIELPDRFVIKCSHGSHCGIVVNDKSALDLDAAMQRLRKWQRRDWYWYGREPPYRGVRPCILVEQHLGQSVYPPDDYKVMCFGGRAEVVQLHRKRGAEQRIDFFDRFGHRIPGMHKPGFGQSQRVEIPRADMALLLPVAERIAREVGAPYLRVDLYLVRGQVYFGEITFFDSSGYRPFASEWAEKWLGSLINITKEAIQ